MNDIDKTEAEIDHIIENSLADTMNIDRQSLPKNSLEISGIGGNVHSGVNEEIGGGGGGGEEINGHMELSVVNKVNEQDDTASIEIFNTALHQYLRIDEEIKSLMTAVKERNEIKRNLGDTLSNYLKAKQIKKVNLDGSYKGKRLEVEVKTRNTGFSKTTVTEVLLNELQEETELFDKIMCAISKTNVLKEVWKLKVIDDKAKSARTGTEHKKKVKSSNLGTCMADAAALLEDDN